MPDQSAGTRSRRVVLGLGGTVDYEVAWDSRVVEDLVEQHGIRSTDLDAPRPIVTERDLVVSVLAFLRDGAGGERFVASSHVIEEFSSRLDTRVTLGGTCVRAAIAMSAVGVASTLHLVSMNDVTRRLLPADVDWICSAGDDTTDPHLIVQYPQGARVRAGDIDVVAPHSNRLIYANDPPHRELLISEQLGDALTDAAVFLVSSLNVIQDRAVLDDRLQSLHRHLENLPDDALVMFEDAEYHVPEFSTVVRDAIAPMADVYSLNEDELQRYVGRTVDLLHPREWPMRWRSWPRPSARRQWSCTPGSGRWHTGRCPVGTTTRWPVGTPWPPRGTAAVTASPSRTTTTPPRCRHSQGERTLLATCRRCSGHRSRACRPMTSRPRLPPRSASATRS